MHRANTSKQLGGESSERKIDSGNIYLRYKRRYRIKYFIYNSILYPL